MPGTVIECPGCKLPLPDGLDASPAVERCESCGLRLRLLTFPALFAPPPETKPNLTALETGEATCFHHDQKRAVATCEACGKFLCQLCDVELPNGHFCAQCFEAGARKGDIPEFERARRRYDRIVWALVLVGLIFWFLSPLLPLVALVLGIVKRREPPSLVHRSRLWLGLALAVAALQVIGSTALWIVIFTST